MAPLEPDLNVIFDAGNSDTGRFHLGAVRNGGRRLAVAREPGEAGEFNLAQPDGVFDNEPSVVRGHAGHGARATRSSTTITARAGTTTARRTSSCTGIAMACSSGSSARRDFGHAARRTGNGGQLVFDPARARRTAQTYLWHNDENAHAGIHRWHLDGVEWMRELKGRGHPG